MRKPNPASRDRLRDRIAPSASASPSAQCCSPSSILLHPRSRTARPSPVRPSPSPSPFLSPSQNHLLSVRGPCPTHRRPSRACLRSPTFDIRVHFVSRRRVQATDGLPDATPISSVFETSGPVVRIISSPPCACRTARLRSRRHRCTQKKCPLHFFVFLHVFFSSSSLHLAHMYSTSMYPVSGRNSTRL